MQALSEISGSSAICMGIGGLFALSVEYTIRISKEGSCKNKQVKVADESADKSVRVWLQAGAEPENVASNKRSSRDMILSRSSSFIGARV